MLSVVTLLAAGALSTSPADTEPRSAEPHVACTQRVQDGGFETGAPWTQSTTGFPPICNFSNCGNGGGTSGPANGQGWVWFGGNPVLQQASVTQNVLLPLGTAHLRFFLRIGAHSGNGSDFMRILIGGDEVFAAYEYTPGFGQYDIVDLDVSAQANGSTRPLRLESTTFGPAVTNFSVDNVSLETCLFPSLSIANAANVTEGDAGSTNAVFDVALSEAVSQQVTVDWTTATASSGAQATADLDYTAGSGTLTFPPQTATVHLSIPVLGDPLDEFDERFAVSLTSPAGATLGDASGEATIVDDDPLPSIAISDATVVEGQTGTTTAQLTVSLAPASGRAVTGSYSTADGSAVAGQDYTATSGPFTLPAGSTSLQLTVPVLGDSVDEIDEIFTARLLAPDYAVPDDPLGVVIIDDDDGPLVRIADTIATEGNAGTTPAAFTVTLSATSPQEVMVDYTTANGTAIEGDDFVATSGTVTFASGTTGAGFPVPIVGDVLDEPNEYFSVLLSNAVDARLSDVDARGTIVDDDGGVLSLNGELSHGFEQWRALAVPNARDLFVFLRPAWSSFEVLIDGASGDLSGRDGLSLVRLAPDLATVLQGADAVGNGPARRLSVSNEQAVPEADYIAVSSTGCTTDCGADDVYRIRVRETTLSAPRFNNTGGQITVVLLQNPTQLTVSGTLHFWASGAQLLAESPFSLGPLESIALDCASIAGLEQYRGSITVTHDGPYAGLVGRAVALEPATGMSFNTVFEVRLR